MKNGGENMKQHKAASTLKTNSKNQKKTFPDEFTSPDETIENARKRNIEKNS